jgi:hypothetical protein
MHDPETVSRVEGIGDLAPVLESERVRERPSRESLRQRLAFEKLHHQEVRPVLTSHVVEGADVRMVQPSYGPSLALQTLAPVLFRGEIRGKDLDGDEALEPGVVGFVDLALPPAPRGAKISYGPR